MCSQLRDTCGDKGSKPARPSSENEYTYIGDHAATSSDAYNLPGDHLASRKLPSAPAQTMGRSGDQSSGLTMAAAMTADLSAGQRPYSLAKPPVEMKNGGRPPRYFEVAADSRQQQGAAGAATDPGYESPRTTDNKYFVLEDVGNNESDSSSSFYYDQQQQRFQPPPPLSPTTSTSPPTSPPPPHSPPPTPFHPRPRPVPFDAFYSKQQPPVLPKPGARGATAASMRGEYFSPLEVAQRQDQDGGGYTSLGDAALQQQAHEERQAQAQDGEYAVTHDNTYEEAHDAPPEYLEILPEYSLQKPV